MSKKKGARKSNAYSKLSQPTVALSDFLLLMARSNPSGNNEQLHVVSKFKDMYIDNVANAARAEYEPIRKGRQKGRLASAQQQKEKADYDLLLKFMEWQKKNKSSLFKDGVLLDAESRVKEFKKTYRNLRDREKRRFPSLLREGRIPSPN
jgi:hypothetical protein